MNGVPYLRYGCGTEVRVERRREDGKLEII